MEAEQERVSASEDGVPSLMDLKRQLPSHCFQSSLSKSISFVVKDFLLVASFAFSFSFLQDSFPTLAFALLPFFCFLQGTMFWAIFVLGHDCGHGSFSSSEKANDFFGHLLHTFILVPFHPWRLSHRKHHKNTGHIDNDEIFYPFRESRRARDADQAKRPHHVQNMFYLGFGWLGYLISGFNGENSHFSVANNSIYSSDRERSLATKSLTLWWIWFSILIVWSYLVGPFVALVHYWIPLIVFATWLVVVTFLHHNEPGTTWLSGDRWSYVAGNLISVDRSYGIFESLHHDIGTHVVHHLFPAIPHYKLREADQALHKVLGPKQIKSKDSIIPAFFRNWSLYRDHLFVPEDAVTYTYPVLSKKLH